MIFHRISESDARPGDHLYRWRYLKLFEGIALQDPDDASEISVVIPSGLNGFREVSLRAFKGRGFLRRVLYDQGDSYLHLIKLSGTSYIEKTRPVEEIIQNARLLLDTNNINLHCIDQFIAPGPGNFARLCCTMSHEHWRAYLREDEHIPSPVNSDGEASNRTSMTLDQESEIESLEARQGCPICMDRSCDTAFNCGHLTCSECAQKLRQCPFCQKEILQKIRLFWP